MNLTLIAAALAIALFLGMLAMVEAGRRIGSARIARAPEGLPVGAGAAEAAVFGLLGLLLAFTFSGATDRFHDRRDLIRQEANAIGTAYLRIDLAAPGAQPELRQLMRRYVDVRLATYSNVEDEVFTRARIAESTALQSVIWKKALEACASPGAAPAAMQLVVPALNEMFDIMTTRLLATRNHPPAAIYYMLAGLCLVGAMLVGYNTSANKKRIVVYPWAFAAVLSLCVYFIIDLEFPRLGLIQVRDADKALVEVRQGMN